MSYKTIILSTYLIACATMSFAQSQPAEIYPARPGSTCPWQPIESLQPAGPQCGFNDLGIPNPGIYACGLVSTGTTCTEHCVFVRCHEI
jgi:hypothetical protein